MIWIKKQPWILWLFLVLLSGWSLRKILWGGQSLFSGDGLIHYSLMHLLQQSLHVGKIPLWSADIYGEHPIFAEGQGGFAYPLHLILAASLPLPWIHKLYPLIGMGIAHFGLIGLGRHFGFSPFVVLFLCIAVVFSAGWFGQMSNLIIFGGIVWIPVVLWRFERWWKTPSVKNAALLAVSSTLLFLAGYPQVAHGMAVMVITIMGVRTLMKIIYLGKNSDGINNGFFVLRQYLVTGTIGVLLTIGLSAVQLFPLYELKQYSVRKEGIDLLFQAGRSAFLRGLIETHSSQLIIPSVSSIFVVAVALMSLKWIRSSLVASYWVVTLLLFEMSLGGGAHGQPLVSWIPGIHQFRHTHGYLHFVVVTLSILAAISLHRWHRSWKNPWKKNGDRWEWF